MLNLIRYNQFLKQQRGRCSSAGWRVLGKEGEGMAKWCRERRQVPASKTCCESTERDGNCSCRNSRDTSLQSHGSVQRKT